MINEDEKIFMEALENLNQSEETSRFMPVSLSELMKKQFKETAWVVEQLIPSEGIIAISGLPSAYKTWLILDIAIRVASGEILFDKYVTNKTGVLIVDEETGERWIQKRILKLHDTYELPIHLLSKTGFKLTQETVAFLIDFSKRNYVGIIIFDSLLRIHTAKDENSAVEMAGVFSLFQLLTKEGITVIFTHHNRKQGILRSSNPSQDMRGSSDILAAVDCHLAVDRKDDCITITQTKLRQAEESKPFKLQIINEEGQFSFEFAGEIDEEKSKKIDFMKATKDLLEQEGRPMYKKELFEKLREGGIEGGYSTFKFAVQDLVDQGNIFEQRGEKNKVFCSLKPFQENQTSIEIKEGSDG